MAQLLAGVPLKRKDGGDVNANELEVRLLFAYVNLTLGQSRSFVFLGPLVPTVSQFYARASRFL